VPGERGGLSPGPRCGVDDAALAGLPSQQGCGAFGVPAGGVTAAAAIKRDIRPAIGQQGEGRGQAPAARLFA